MISKEIYAFLSKKGMTANRLAELVDITAVQLSRIMNGHSMPSRITMEKIAKVLDADISFSSSSGQWSLISQILGVSMRSVYGSRCDSLNSDPASSCSEDVLSIPLVDTIDISSPDFQDKVKVEKLFAEASEFMSVPLKDLGIIGNDKPFAVRMYSDSMSEAGIPYGSYAAVNPYEPVYNGDPVLAKWGKQEDVTLRWFFDYCEQRELRSSNPIKYPPIIVKKVGKTAEDDNTFYIYGKIMAVYARPRRGI